MKFLSLTLFAALAALVSAAAIDQPLEKRCLASEYPYMYDVA